MDDLITACPTRKPDLVEVAAGDDLLVYDPTTHRGYCLRPQAAVLWRRCDGITPLEHLIDAEDGVLWETVICLHDRGLLMGIPRTQPLHPVTRRGFMRATGAVGAGTISLPLLYSVLVPTAAAAASPFGGNLGPGSGTGGMPGNGGSGGILSDGDGGSGSTPGGSGSSGPPQEGGPGGGSKGKHGHGGSKGKHKHHH